MCGELEGLEEWKKEEYAICHSMVWREGKDHIMDYYFCMINLNRINYKNKHYVQYPDIHSAIRPIPHGPDGNMEYSFDSKHSDMTVVAGNDT